MTDVPEHLDLYEFYEARIDLALELGIIDSASEAKFFGDTIDPPSDEELIHYLNERYHWDLLMNDGAFLENELTFQEIFEKVKDLYDNPTGLLFVRRYDKSQGIYDKYSRHDEWLRSLSKRTDYE